MESSVDSGDDKLALYVRQFDEAEDNSRQERSNAEIYRDYYDGQQWTSAERSTLEKRGQPCITDNRIKDKVDHLLGMERQTRTDPRAWPRNPSEDDKGKAEAATDALRYVWDMNNGQQLKSKCFEDYCIEGIAAAEVVVEQRQAGKNPRVVMRRIRWDRFYRDPYSMLPDFSDAQYMGIVVWLDLEAAKKKYPTLAESFDSMFTNRTSNGAQSDTYDDKPRWLDVNRRRVQILEHYHKEAGFWNRCVFSKAGVIEESKPLLYVDEDGNPDCPIVAQSCYTDREGRRYGVVARYKDIQDEINKRRSKTLHLLTVRQIVMEDGANTDEEKLRKEVQRPDGVVKHAPGTKLEVIQNADLANGQFQLLQDAIAAFQNTGPNAALQGHQGNQSGRAQEVAAMGGQIQLGTLFDGIRHFQKRLNQKAWLRVRQYWTAPEWVRVTDDLNNIKWVGLNVPGDPRSVQPAETDVDIIIDESPDVVTLQAEQWTQLTELAAKGVPIPPKMLIQASSLKNKQQLIDELDGKGEGGNGIPPQVAQQIEQIAQAQQQVAQQLETQKQEAAAESQKVAAEKMAVEAARKAFEAERSVAQTEFEASRKAAAAEVKAMQAELNARMTVLEAKKQEIASFEKIVNANVETATVRAESVTKDGDQSKALSEFMAEIQKQLAEQQQQAAEQQASLAEQVKAQSEAMAKLVTVLAEKVKDSVEAKPEPRKIVMKGPSGRTYEATVQ